MYKYDGHYIDRKIKPELCQSHLGFSQSMYKILGVQSPHFSLRRKYRAYVTHNVLGVTGTFMCHEKLHKLPPSLKRPNVCLLS